MKTEEIIKRAIEMETYKPTQEEDEIALKETKELSIKLQLDFEFMEAYPGMFEEVHNITTEEKEQWKEIRKEYLNEINLGNIKIK